MSNDAMIEKLESVVAEFVERQKQAYFAIGGEEDFDLFSRAIDTLDNVIKLVKGLEE